ncbi:hypothetical protein JCM11491_003762 [Sporobolomyces phaffii]
MSNWRGGARPAFPSQPANGQPPRPPPTSGAFSSFNPAAPSPFALGDRGRGRGRGRGAARGLPSKRGGANLSWKRTEPQLAQQSAAAASDAQLGGEGHRDEQQMTTSAFEAFGNGPSGSGFSINPIPSTSTTAFGAPSSAFGSSGTFSAFPPTTSAFAPSSSATFTSSPFANPTPFSAAPAPPVFGTEPSTEEEEDEEYNEAEEDERTPSPEPEPEPEAAPEVKRNPAQISTLEVLGEDSDARRKRFESTLPNNRYLELKPRREEQRLKAIKQGLIPDPSKPMRLDQATDFEGTCEEMCPEWERQEREYQNNVDPLERYPGTTRIDPSRAVKAFHRPAAGNDQPLPSDVRPPSMLYKTLDYLFHTLLPQHNLAVTHPFVRDRTRSVRQDFTVQNVRGQSAIECNERIARYHILALGTLREQSGFSESQELEQLRKVLKSLNEFYDDLRRSNPDVSLPNEAEFRSYHLLTHLRDPDIIWSTELLPRHVFSHPLLQTALELHRLAQRSNTGRGERASPNAFSRFFKLVESPRVPYLFGCILSTHFNEIRKNALDALKGAYLKQHSAFPLKTLTKVLGCDDEADTRSVCEQLGVVVRTDERGKLVAELHKGAVLKSTTLKLTVSRRLVEGKRGATTYQAVIDGANYPSRAVSKIPMTPGLAPAQPPPAQPQPRPPLPATSTPSSASSFAGSSFPGFGVSTSVSAPPTAFPTPVPTPPPFSSAPAKPSLDATASPFVPSFGAAHTSTAPPPKSFSFAPSHPQPAAPGFTFAPTATPFVPASSNPAPPPPVPNFFTAAARSSPPPVPAFVPPPPLEKPFSVPAPASPVPTAPPPSSLRRLSSTLTSHHHHHSPPSIGNASPRLEPSHAPAHLLPKDVKPPRVDHSRLIETVAAALTRELLVEAIRAPVRKVVQGALKSRWTSIQQREETEKRLVGERLGQDVLTRLGKVLVREVAVSVARDEKLRRQVFEVWSERAYERRKRREEAEERKREWEQVLKGLSGQSGRKKGRLVEEDEDDAMSDEELVEEEEEEIGVAGNQEVGFEFGGLSIGVADAAQNRRGGGANEPAHDPQRDLAEQLRLAAETRQRIWANSTFLDILALRLSRATASHRRRAAWTTLVVTRSTESSFATWLSCKFGLDEDRRARVVTKDAHLVVQMLESAEEPEQDDLDSTGLILFDCTALPGHAFDWEEARGHLETLLADVDRDSLYRPTLLILVCPDRSLFPEEETALKSSISGHLDLSAHSDSLAAFAISIVKLDGAEAEFQSVTAKLVSSVSVRPERIRQPLELYSKPLLEAWRTSVRSNLDRDRRNEIVPTIVTTFIGELQEIVTEIDNVIHPPSSNSVSIPSFPDVKGSFQSTVASYLASDEFAQVGHFPEVASAFAQRPPLSDHDLARLVVDLLDQFTTNSYPSTLTTLQLSLDTTLRPALRRLEDSLVESSQAVRQASRKIDALREDEVSSRKKRKASITGNDSMNRSPKKPSVDVQASTETRTLSRSSESSLDRLTALERLMKETKALLST